MPWCWLSHAMFQWAFWSPRSLNFFFRMGWLMKNWSCKLEKELVITSRIEPTVYWSWDNYADLFIDQHYSPLQPTPKTAHYSPWQPTPTTAYDSHPAPMTTNTKLNTTNSVNTARNWASKASRNEQQQQLSRLVFSSSPPFAFFIQTRLLKRRRLARTE